MTLYLKSLEMQGFKSFPDKTKLNFEHGATVIVGPNGSGKSNISDAMRWVLGEISSKSLRGSKMEDVIFGGADSRKPMGFAEVSVTFDNTDPNNRLDAPYDEVIVTRRYYRSGESEYFINKRAVRLRDIYELFMNTGIGREGYSIIGQGKIAEIISRKSEDRRSIFEDASGIAKFRHKKTESERKLAQTEDNMTRVNDIFVEISAQVGPLEKEAEKAKRAIELLETKKKVDVQLWFFDTEKYRNEIAKFENLYKQSSFELQIAEEAITNFEAQRDRLTEASQTNRYESEKLLTKIREQTDSNHKLESTYRVNENDALHIQSLIDASHDTKASIAASIENEKRDIDNHIARIEQIKQEAKLKFREHDEAEDEIARLEGEITRLENEIAVAFGDMRALESEQMQLKVRLSVIENAKSSDNDKNDTLLSEMQEYARIDDELTQNQKQVQRAVNDYEEDIARSEQKIAELSENLQRVLQQKEGLDTELTQKKLLLQSTRQRIDTYKAMEDQFEGYNNSVRFVMKAYSEGKLTNPDGTGVGKIHGPISKLISVEEKYLVAVETSLGAAIQNIVVENESVAKAAMLSLKRNEQGRATFMPITAIKAPTISQDMKAASGFKGFIAFADDLVSTRSEYMNIVSYMLGRIAVFDNIDNATEMAKALGYKVRAITLDGQQINVGGSFTGGSVKHGHSILSRAGEVKKLEGECKKIDEAILRLSETHSALVKDLEKAELEIKALEDRKKIISLMAGSENTKLQQINAKIDANKTLMNKLQEDYDNILRMRERYEEDYTTLTAQIAAYDEKISVIAELRGDKDIERNTLTDKKDELSQSLTAIYIRINELQKDIETENLLIDKSKEHIEALKSDIEGQDEKVKEYHEQLITLERERTENRALLDEGERILEALNSERARLEENGTEFEKKINAINAKIKEKLESKDVLVKDNMFNENKLTNLRSEYDKLSSKLWDDHELTRNQAMELGYEEITAEMRPEIARIQTECRNKLRAIGHVDLDAVNKYKEVKERYDYMDKQIRDLNASKLELEKIIAQLDEEMKTSFIESFNKINENFNRVFVELFGGGYAELQLADPEDVLNCGIEIKAAPPGKIIKNLMQLSGGEQAFIAIALFFAVLQVNPSPFCILDEIEAALDEANVSRFSEYIKKYTGGTQFILITHRRGTMESANRLYGVTMPEHGISKILSLNVADIAKKKEGDWDGIFG